MSISRSDSDDDTELDGGSNFLIDTAAIGDPRQTLNSEVCWMGC